MSFNLRIDQFPRFISYYRSNLFFFGLKKKSDGLRLTTFIPLTDETIYGTTTTTTYDYQLVMT